ncbi:MAG: hypothetical protein QOH05_249, partial [Acetobacteraceae bacterium]|nr:hypothetical protein [Acetobacteraceae bacterium]
FSVKSQAWVARLRAADAIRLMPVGRCFGLLVLARAIALSDRFFR